MIMLNWQRVLCCGDAYGDLVKRIVCYCAFFLCISFYFM